MDPLSIAAGTAGLLSMGIAVCNGLLEYYDSWKDAEGDLKRMYNSIEALTKTIKILQVSIGHKEFNRNVVEQVQESIESTRHGILRLKKKLDKIKIVPQNDGWREKSIAQFQRTLFPFKESTLVKVKELGNELRDNLSLALNALQM